MKRVSSAWTGSLSRMGDRTFVARLSVRNTGTRTINGWNLQFQLANGQVVRTDLGVDVQQRSALGRDVSVTSRFSNGRIPPGATVSGIGFTASYDGLTNAKPPNFTLNGKRCGSL